MPPRETTKAQEMEIVRRYQEGERAVSLGAEFGISDTGIRNILRRHGVVPNQGNEKIGDEVVTEMERLYLEKRLSTTAVAEKLGLSRSGVRVALLRTGIKLRSKSECKIKLTRTQARELVDRYREGATYVELEKQYGVTSAVVRSELEKHGVRSRVGWARYRTKKWTDRLGRTFTFKSSWEKAYAEYLDSRGIEWDYEPKTFSLLECKCYTPDFWVYNSDGTVKELVEIKGWLDRKGANRIREFRNEYPEFELTVLGPKELADLELVEGWYRNHSMSKVVSEIAYG